MANEKLIKQTKTVFTEIIHKLVDPAFKFSEGGATDRILGAFFDNLQQEFGDISDERLVDICVCAAYTFRQRVPIYIKQVFGVGTIARYKKQTKSQRFYQSQWLESVSLSRENLVKKIQNRKDHPYAKYIYIPSEEQSKRRWLNHKAGFFICQASTLGWSPLSGACQECSFVVKCQEATKIKYPELYRLRTEHGHSTKQ